ncbi:Heme/hemopexin-binding protein [Ferriphaselus amnicola]|uniref:Heme/hemopexin-binding protein n=2 Tax=Ferriphaselus amnicola TaxID=1188319 RepID=A0A2Z6GDK8_9PROT|nr:Heme/hemopexin-binding protein [Ferriphaselus amnicola]
MRQRKTEFRRNVLAVTLAASFATLTPLAHALPQGGVVAAGQATMGTAGTALTVTQTTASATYNWQSFNIGKAESVHFQQPSATSVALNYVLGNTNSIIDGRLSSNGQLFLSNPNGILFGSTAQVNVAGLTLNAGTSQISNAGTINVNGGTLIANAGIINNTGIIEASSVTKIGGKVVLTANTAVINTGGVRANGVTGGSVLLSAGTSVLQMGNILASGNIGSGGGITLSSVNRIIQTSNALSQANGVTSGGAISYRSNTATAEGGLLLSGTMSANGNTSGGSVVLTGANVELLAAKLTATGIAAGGTISIGGGFQGKNIAIANAQKSSVNAATTINASGTQGNGGNVVIWSNQQTTFSGNINATGGIQATRGGQVEVSGKQLGFNGRINTVTANGISGSLLLDPVNITIQSITGPKVPLVVINKAGSLTQLPNGNLVISNPGDMTVAPSAGAVWLLNGKNGALISTLTGTRANDLVGSDGVTVLPSGNFLVNSTNWSNGAQLAAGAVTWASGVSGLNGVVSSANSLVGSRSLDRVGFAGITVLSNGGYVVNTYSWNNNAGAVTWGSGVTGVRGIVSAANSLIGGTSDNILTNTVGDQVGASGVVQLLNGNYLIRSYLWGGGRGAVTWANAALGVKGVVSGINSLVGAVAGDWVGGDTNVGVQDVLEVGTDHYLIVSPRWGGNKGAVTWGSCLSGVVGVVGVANSLTGSVAGVWGRGDAIGSGGVTLLANHGNYLISSPWWGGGKGAVTWGNGLTGTVGAVSALNSLVGSVVTDGVGAKSVSVLANGNYVIATPNWGTGKGAVTWGNGAAGVSGAISSINSLVGAGVGLPTVSPVTGLMTNTGGDLIGSGGITALTNGNFVVSSPNWSSGKGASTFGNGLTGVVGFVSATNSLVGTKAGDGVGSTFALTNGNYVTATPLWDNGAIVDAGSVTWGNGLTGTVGQVTSVNSYVGGTVGDQVGGLGITPLANGSYVVRSAFGAKGAITWGSGGGGSSGLVSSQNSLVGSVVGDALGNDKVGTGVQALTNGNYVVASAYWGGGKGAVTWGNGLGGTVGTVTPLNSLIGSLVTDNVGGQFGSLMTSGGVTALPNGNYLVVSYDWAGRKGAVTWGNGSVGTKGVISSLNSLVGSVAGDLVGGYGTWVLKNGDYLIVSSSWNNWAGAATRGSALSGVRGVISGTNSLIGNIGGFGIGDNVGFGGGIVEQSNGSIIVPTTRGSVWSQGASGLTGTVSNFSPVAGTLTQLSGNRIAFVDIGTKTTKIFDTTIISPLQALPTSSVGFAATLGQAGLITPQSIVAITNAGTAVTLQASNDIVVNSPIVTVPNVGIMKGGAITLQAGRNVLINASITTANGALTLIANDTVASGVVSASRLVGGAVIRQATTSTINVGTGILTFDLRNGGAGAWVTLGNIVAGGLNVTSRAGAITQAVATKVAVAGATTLTANSGAVAPAVPVRYAITLANAGNNFVGAVTTNGLGVSLLDSVGGIILGNTNATGALAVTSRGGAITQAAATKAVVTGATTLTANNGTVAPAVPVRYGITLANATNNFGGLVTANGLTVTLADLNALNASVNATGATSLSAAGALNVAGRMNTTLATKTTGALSTTTFGATTVGTSLAVTSTGAVKKLTPATAMTVAAVATTVANPKVTVNGVVGALIP